MTWEERRDAFAEKTLSEMLPKLYETLDSAGITYSEDQLEHMGEDSIKLGWNACREDESVKKLVEALESWAKYEQDEIKRIGPYTASSKIPGFIERAEKAIADWKGEP